MTYILSTAYLGPIQYYAKLFGHATAIEERCDHYVKQTYRNRCIIATADGALPLTIPVEGRPKSEGGDSKTPVKDIRLSDHGRWRQLHWHALVAAYENSPFFEYYADDFAPIYEGRQRFLVDFNAELQSTVCRLLDIQPDLRINTAHYLDAMSLPDAIDLRERIRPKLGHAWDTDFQIVPYYQVFAQRTEFLPNLSIVDLLFNLGPESRLVLYRSHPARAQKPLTQGARKPLPWRDVPS